MRSTTTTIFRSATLVLVLVLFGSTIYAQSDIHEDLPTGKTDRKVKDHHSPRAPKSTSLRYIYKKDGHRLLIGNPCAIHHTRELGFEYQLRHKKLGLEEELHRVWHNTGVKSILFFTRNPFWKLKINRQLKNCRQQSGDYIG